MRQEICLKSQSSQTNLWRKSRLYLHCDFCFTVEQKLIENLKKKKIFPAVSPNTSSFLITARRFRFPRLILCGKLFSDFVAAKSKQKIQNHKQGLTKTRICRWSRYYLTSIYVSEIPLRSYFVKVEPKEENGSKVRLCLCPKQRRWFSNCGGRFVSLFCQNKSWNKTYLLLWLFMALVYRYIGIRLLASSYSL